MAVITLHGLLQAALQTRIIGSIVVRHCSQTVIKTLTNDSLNIAKKEVQAGD